MKQLSKMFVDNLEKARAIDSDTHEVHHKFVESCIVRNNKRIELMEKVKEHIVKYGAIALITGIGVAIWHYVKAGFHS